MTYRQGAIIEIRGDSILKGQKACVIEDFEETVYCCSNGGYVGADFPIRHELPKHDVVPFEDVRLATRKEGI